MASILTRHQTRAKTPKPVSSANMTVFIAPCYTERLNWLLGVTLCPCRPNYCRIIASLKTPLPVKYFFPTLPPALMKERHFALAENVAHQHCQTNQGSLVIRFRSESIRPMHLFGRNRDHDC